MPARRKLWGILTRKERWGLSGSGWLAIVLVAFAATWFGVHHAYQFLAVTDRVQSKVLVVEGWVLPYTIRVAGNEFRDGHYDRILATGGPVVGNGGYVNDFQTSASVGAELLQKTGIPRELVQMVPSRVIGRDRTYSSAVALREWFHAHDIPVTSMNVVTEGTHARRTRMLFQKAFGRHTAIGIIAVHSPDYDPKHWWRYSEGVRDVIDESVAYLYAICFVYLFEPFGMLQPLPESARTGACLDEVPLKRTRLGKGDADAATCHAILYARVSKKA